MSEPGPQPSALPGLGWGIFLVLTANLFFAFVDTSTKWLIGAGIMATQLAFMRYAVHFLITCGERLARGKLPRPIDASARRLVLLRSFCLVSATLANFTALGHLSLSVTSAMLYLAPIFICLFARPILGEQINPGHWLAIVVGFLGALVVVWPFGQPVNWYAVLMLYPAAAMALYQVLTRKLTARVTPATLQFYTGALGSLALLPLALLDWQTPESGLAMALMLGIGAFAWAGHEALTRAHAYAPASTLAPYGYSFVVYLMVAGVIVYNDIPAPNVLLGAGLIFVSGTLAWNSARTRHLHRA